MLFGIFFGSAYVYAIRGTAQAPCMLLLSLIASAYYLFFNIVVVVWVRVAPVLFLPHLVFTFCAGDQVLTRQHLWLAFLLSVKVCIQLARAQKIY